MKPLFFCLSLLMLLLGCSVASGIMQDYGTDWRAVFLSAILLGCAFGTCWTLFRCAQDEPLD